MRPGKWEIYKSKGAIQVSLILPEPNAKGWIDKEGSVLLEVASSSGDKNWDWDNKISFALSMPDIALLMDTKSKSEVSLFHDYKGTIKKMVVRWGEGKFEGTYTTFFSQGDNKVMVPFSGSEWALFMNLLLAAAPRMLGWC